MIIIFRCVVTFKVPTDLRVVWVVDIGKPPGTGNPNHAEIGRPASGAIKMRAVCFRIFFFSFGNQMKRDYRINYKKFSICKVKKKFYT